MSPFALLFLAIQQRLQAITIDDQPLFKTIDQDLGQLEDNTRGMNRPPVNWPCALIDIDDATYTNVGENSQLGIANICIRIGFPPFSSTEMHVPDTYRNKALYFYDIEQAVITAIQGWAPGTVTITAAQPDADPPVAAVTQNIGDIFGHLIRVRATKEDRNDLLRVRAIMFTLSMDDNSTQNPETFISPITLNLTTQFEP